MIRDDLGTPMTRPTIIYLHGFRSSSQSAKAQLFVRRVAELPSVHRPRLLVPDLPPVALTLPPDSGLVLVETSHRGTTVPSEPEPQLPAGPRRARKPRVVVPEEPLQIVETRKEQQPAN